MEAPGVPKAATPVQIHGHLLLPVPALLAVVGTLSQFITVPVVPLPGQLIQLPSINKINHPYVPTISESVSAVCNGSGGNLYCWPVARIGFFNQFVWGWDAVGTAVWV